MGNTEILLKVFLPVYFIILLAEHAQKVNSFRKKYQIDPLAATREDPLMYIFHLYRTIMFLITAVVIVIFSFFSGIYDFLVPVKYLETDALRISGMIVLTGALLLVRISQNQLRESWRMGLDHSGKKSPLITDGIYRWSRNPISLGLILMSAGIFLVLPNVLTFPVFIVTFLICHVRVRIEEEHMKKRYGDEYKTYLNKTRRWF